MDQVAAFRQSLAETIAWCSPRDARRPAGVPAHGGHAAPLVVSRLRSRQAHP